jgi:hypothetical protein
LSTGIINTKERLPFGTDMANSSTSNYESAWKYIRKHFLGNGKSYLSMKSEDELFEIGIVPIGSELPRLFPNGTIKLSALQNKGLDIDGVSFEEKGVIPVGGHIISDWELNELSDYERDIAAKREGCFLNNEFEFTQNCRAMSKYHNDRMGVLPLSIYMEVINESDKVVRVREKQFREEVTSRLSKYHKAA